MKAKSFQGKFEIPEKLYFRIGEVAKLLELKPYVLRYWETEFPQIAPSKRRNGQRLYARKEVEEILKIKGLLYDNQFTIAGARHRLKEIKREEKQEVKTKQMALPIQEEGVPKKFLESMRKQLVELEKVL